MRPDSDLDYALRLNPLPAIVLNATDDVILAQNDAGGTLFGTAMTGQSLRRFLKSEPNQLAVFLEAVTHFGSYIDTNIGFQDTTSAPLKLQTHGTYAPEHGPAHIMLTFLNLSEQDRRNKLAEQDAHQRAGLLQWQNVYGFFQEVERQNQLILDAAGEGIYGINAEGKATFVNRAAQEMLGWDADDLIGRELHSIIHHTHLNGDHFPAHSCPIYHTFRKDKTQRVENDAFWRKDGKPILVEYVSTPIYDQSVLAGAVVIFRDVTERKENERKLRSAMEEVEQLRTQLEQENDYLLTEIRTERSHSGIVGVSPAIRNLNAQIDLVADTNTNVLITGESGTGKNLTVSAIHDASPRSKRPLIKVNCSAISIEDFEAEFFGHRKGAFRGAMRDRVGRLGLAQNGILHLDEVSELPLDFQAKLMAVVQDGHYRRIGDQTDIPINATIISTTGRNLEAEVKAGRFRQDLYFALSVFPIRCDALRERPDDIPYLAKHFVDLTTRRLRLSETRLSKANIDQLLAYDWPGNVRELQNVIERAVILAHGGRLQFDIGASGGSATASNDVVMSEAEIRTLERENLIACMRRAKGRVSGAGGAAKLLGIAPTTVYSRLSSLQLDRSDWENE